MSDRELSGGGPVTPDYNELKDNGQQKGYVVLSAEERAKGYVRPVRRTYIHVGPLPPKNPLRDLTPEEHKRYDEYGYVKYEEYPREVTSAVIGKFWTQKMIDALNGGCRSSTRMAQDIAETYARNPKFYGSTFCISCGKHLPVDEFVWVDDETRVGS